MPLIPQIHDVSHIHFALSRGANVSGDFEFRGSVYNISVENETPHVNRLTPPDENCFWGAIVRFFSRKKQEPSPDSSVVLDNAIRHGLSLRRCGEHVTLERTALQSFLRSGWDLSGMDFSGCNLARMKLASTQPVIARGATFNRVKMTDASFLGWDLSGSTFQDCNMEMTIFRHVKLNRVTIQDCDLEDAALLEVDLENSKFAGCGLENTEFGGWLRNVTFDRCQSTLLDMRRTSIVNCRFIGFNVPTPVHETRRPDQYGINFNNASVKDTHFEYCDLGATMFFFGHWENILFAHSNLMYCTFFHTSGDRPAFVFDDVSRFTLRAQVPRLSYRMQPRFVPVLPPQNPVSQIAAPVPSPPEGGVPQ